MYKSCHLYLHIQWLFYLGILKNDSKFDTYVVWCDISEQYMDMIMQGDACSHRDHYDRTSYGGLIPGMLQPNEIRR